MPDGKVSFFGLDYSAVCLALGRTSQPSDWENQSLG